MEADLLGMPFDQYQRYRTSADLLLALGEGTCPAPLLDVGGLSGDAARGWQRPLAGFLPGVELTVLDREPLTLPGYVAGDGRHLPFPDRAFAAVVCNDVLEHVPAADRPAFLAELVRVADRFVVLAAPCRRPETELAERMLLEYVRRLLGGEHRQLKEHLDCGLPEADEVEAFFAGQECTCRRFDSGYLPGWILAMMIKHQLLALPDGAERNAAYDRTLNQTRYPADQRIPGYRQVFVAARRESDRSRLDAALGRVLPVAPSAGIDPADLLQIQLLMGTDLALTGQQVAVLAGQLTAGQTAEADRERRLARLEAYFERLGRTPFWRLWKRLRGNR